MQSWPQNRLVFIGVVLLVLLIGGVFVIFNRRPQPNANPVTISIWGTAPKAGFDALSGQYAALRPNVKIVYSELDPNTYDSSLIAAFASGQGPDAFMVGNQDVISHASLITPATSTQITQAQIGSVFPAAVGEDMVFNGQAYALPLSMDTLALFYNKDLFDKAGIPLPPKTWQDVLNDIPKLRQVNAGGQLTRGALALGGPESSVAHAADILSLLMIQNGTIMNTSEGAASFAEGGNAAQSLRFYLDFENPSSAAYSWTEGFGNSRDAFAAGQVAMMLGYHRDIAAIKAKSPFLNFAVVPMVQTADGSPVNYPSYSGLTVWRQSRVASWAWDFIIFASTNTSGNQAYLAATGEPPVLRTNIAAVSAASDVAPFAPQALSARSWRVADYDKMKGIFSAVILRSAGRQQTPEEALSTAEQQLNQGQ